MIHLTKAQYDHAMVAEKERDRFAQSNATLLAALKATVAAIPNVMHPARMQGQAAIDLAEMGHVPRRPETVEQPIVQPLAWIPVGERLPATGVLCLVRSPATEHDWTDEDRIDMDFISEDWEDWNNHCESYEHYMAVGGSHAGGPDVECVGPSEKAPYTHWMQIPEVPKVQP